MKTTLTIISILVAGTLQMLSAQSGPLTVKLYTTDSTSSQYGPMTAAMVFSFSNEGKDSLDMYDMGNLGNLTNGRDYSSPFTTSAENEVVSSFDHRYFFTAPRTIEFGIYAAHSAKLSITSMSMGSVPDYNDSIWNEEVGNIYLEDLTSTIFYDILNDTAVVIVPMNTTATTGYQLHFFPAMRITPIAESCSGFDDGSLQISNPGSSMWTLFITGPNGSFSTTVFQPDTTIDGLAPGSYNLTAFTNGLVSDGNHQVTINAHPPVLPSFTPSATIEGQFIDIDFTNTTANTYAWYWDMGDGNTYTTQNVTHQYSSPAFYTVSLVATDSSGCTGLATDIVEITLLPPAAPPSFNNNNGPQGRNTTPNQDPDLTQRDGNTLVITQAAETAISQIDVYTMGGQLVASQNPTSTVTELNLAKGGCYLVMMTLANGEVKTERILLGVQ